MKIPNKYKEYFEIISPSQRKTLEDSKTKLFIKATGELCVVTVDKGIVTNTAQNIRKCDFLVYDEANSVSSLIELKGEVIKDAYEQLRASLINITNVPECDFIIESVYEVRAYIVTPKMRIPSGINERERVLGKALAKKCKHKVENVVSLIRYVTVVPKTHSFSENNRHITCSNAYPLAF